jgi:hypothetical protein
MTVKEQDFPPTATLPGSTGQPIMPRHLLASERLVLGERDDGQPEQVGVTTEFGGCTCGTEPTRQHYECFRQTAHDRSGDLHSLQYVRGAG